MTQAAKLVSTLEQPRTYAKSSIFMDRANGARLVESALVLRRTVAERSNTWKGTSFHHEFV